MAVTLKDVAQLAGVSTSTVSRTCKDHPSISEETKEKVRRAMAELGYESGFMAPPITPQEPKSIGIILPPSRKEAYENTFYLEAVRGISAFCNQKQYANTLVTGYDEDEIISVIKSMVKNNQADSFIVLYSKLNDSVINYLYNEGLLYVLIGKANQFANQTIYIDNDNFLAGQDATEYLIHKGHRKIGFIVKDPNLTCSVDRKSGYHLALMNHEIPVISTYCIDLSKQRRNYFNEILTYMQQPDRPTAVVVSDDIIAFTLNQVCFELGLRVPDDLSIIGFNNSIVAKMSAPPLTSIDVNSFQLGIEAASQIINHIVNPNLMATKIIVPHQLVERDSCKNM